MTNRYISDQNKVVMIMESGTYGVSGAVSSEEVQWIGLVQENSIDNPENPDPSRHVGALTRSVEQWNDGPLDVTGTLSYNPQDMRLLAHAIGSVHMEVTLGTSTNTATQIDTDSAQNIFTSGTGRCDAPFSFALEDSKQAQGTGKNFKRIARGCCINTATLSASQGEKVSIDIDWLGQSAGFASGATQAVVGGSKIGAYLWSDITTTVSGTTMDTVKDLSLEINNNLTGPHYLNGSRQIGAPFPGNRDYVFTLTGDLDAGSANSLYEGMYLGGSEFNCTLDLDRDNKGITGSQHATFIMSGCRINSFEVPSTVEGAVEFTMEIIPQNINFIDYTGSAYTGSYNPY